MQEYMKKLAVKANKIIKESGVRFNHVVSNDMASNYYIEYKGEEGYIDQYTLQEYFDGHEGDDDQLTNGYEIATDEEKAQALAELALGNYNLL